MEIILLQQLTNHLFLLVSFSHALEGKQFFFSLFHVHLPEGGVRVCGDAVLRYFWCGFAEIFILTCGIAV